MDSNQSIGLILRPYQELGNNGCRQAIVRQKYRRIVYYLPTGAGKTICALDIIQRAVERGNPVAFICNRLQLIQQISRVLNEYGIRHGIIQGENTHSTDLPVIVCSIQTISKRGLPEHIKILIIDECHACPGTKAYIKIMKDRISIGLTATPQAIGMGAIREELGEEPLFQTIVAPITMKELIAQGYLVDADIWGPSRQVDLTRVKVVAGEYQEDCLAAAMDKSDLIGDVVEQWLKIAYNKLTMVFAVNIPHSQHICDEFIKAGINAVHVDYRMKDTQKTEIYDKFRAGRITVLCNCALLSEGADFPSAECLVLARPVRSRVRLVQMFGRILRPSPGKERAIILDHGSCIQRLGFPWDFSCLSLDDGKRKTVSQKKKLEAKIQQPVECAKCHKYRPIGVRQCPNCGFEPHQRSEVEHKQGTLVKINGKQTKTQTLAETGKQSIYSQLQYVAAKEGRSNKWINAKFKSIFNEWPNGLRSIPVEPTGPLLSLLHSQKIAWWQRKKGKT